MRRKAPVNHQIIRKVAERGEPSFRRSVGFKFEQYSARFAPSRRRLVVSSIPQWAEMDGRAGAENRISNYRLPSRPKGEFLPSWRLMEFSFPCPTSSSSEGALSRKNSLEKGWKGEGSGGNFGTVESARLIFNLADEKLISSPEEKTAAHFFKVISRNCPRKARQRKFIC